MTDPSQSAPAPTKVPLPLEVDSLENIAADHREQYEAAVGEPGFAADGSPVPGRQFFRLKWIPEDDRLNYFRHYIEIMRGRLLVVPPGQTPDTVSKEN